MDTRAQKGLTPFGKPSLLQQMATLIWVQLNVRQEDELVIIKLHQRPPNVYRTRDQRWVGTEEHPWLYLLSTLGLTDETLLTETIVTPRQRMNSPELWAGRKR